MKKLLLILLCSPMIGLGQWLTGLPDIDGEVDDDQSGYTVSLSDDGKIVAIGTPYNDGNGTDAGHVRIYEFDGSSWLKLGNDIDGEAAGDWSGCSVSISGDGSIVAIGAERNIGSAPAGPGGHVRIYSWDGSSWNQLGNDIDGSTVSEFSGNSVSLSSNGLTVAIGAARHSPSGQTRIYSWNGSSWNQLGQAIEGEDNGDRSGSSVALSSDGSRVAIGAERNIGAGTQSWSQAGHVRVYNFNGSSWTQLGLDIDGTDNNGFSGSAVSLSEDGNTLASGSGSVNGRVSIYRWGGNSWTQLGLDINGNGGDRLGSSISLSSSGDTAVIGAPDGSGSHYGAVKVYIYSGSSWVMYHQYDGWYPLEWFGSSVSLSSDGRTIAVGATEKNATSTPTTKSGFVRFYSVLSTEILNG